MSKVVVETPLQSGIMIRNVDPSQLPIDCYIPTQQLPIRRKRDGSIDNYIPRSHIFRSPLPPHDDIISVRLTGKRMPNSTTIKVTFTDAIDDAVVMELLDTQIPQKGLEIITGNITNSQLSKSCLRRT